MNNVQRVGGSVYFCAVTWCAVYRGAHSCIRAVYTNASELLSVLL